MRIQIIALQLIVMQAGKTRKKINQYVIHLTEPLGDGAYGKVYQCHEEPSQAIFAVKTIDKSQFDNNPYMLEAVRQELAIHSALKHKNIVQVIDLVQTAHNYYIIMEFCSGGNLRKLLHQNKKFVEMDAIHCIKCICWGFQPLLQKGVLHRDLKPQNIVIQGQQLKITDFGFAKALSSSRQMTRTVIGTPLYMSPQILAKEPYSSKCDIWSVGIIFYELLIGSHPWSAINMTELSKKIRASPKVKFPDDIHISQKSKEFISGCLSIEQENRFSWLQIYENELMGEDFKEVANLWKKNYISAVEKLDNLKYNIEIEKLVGVFLKKKVNALNFNQFASIMVQFIPGVKENELGPMYQLFDKDSNGVIDFDEFVGGLSDCPQSILQLLNHLLTHGYTYQQLVDYQFFMQVSEPICNEISTCQNAYILISNMEMNSQ